MIIREFPTSPEFHHSVLKPDHIFLDCLVSGGLSATRSNWRIFPIFPGLEHRTIREYESITRDLSFFEVMQWVNGDTLGLSQHLIDLPTSSSRHISLYCDYKHFNAIFEDCIKKGTLSITDEKICVSSGSATLIEVLCWRKILNLLRLGHEKISPVEIPTLWFGSYGAHSPLHYDTYGKNVVVQLHGRKRWLLWAPNDMSLETQRVPYEESSVYSTFDPLQFMALHGVRYPEELRRQFPNVVEVVLEEGDVLIVPPKWWHFVITESKIALSCNLWIPNEPLDKEERVAEAASQFIFNALSASISRCGIDTSSRYSGWRNPSEPDATELSATEEDACCPDKDLFGLELLHDAILNLIEHDNCAATTEEGDGASDEDAVTELDMEAILKELVNIVIQPKIMKEFVKKIFSRHKVNGREKVVHGSLISDTIT